MISADRLGRISALRAARERQAGRDLAQCRQNHRTLLARQAAIQADIGQCRQERQALYKRVAGEMSLSGLWGLKLDEQQIEQRRLDLQIELAALAEQIEAAALRSAKALRTHSDRVRAGERFSHVARIQERLREQMNSSVEEELTEEMAYVR